MIEQVPDHIMNPEVAQRKMPVEQVQAAGELAAHMRLIRSPLNNTSGRGTETAHKEQTDRAAKSGYDLNAQSNTTHSSIN